MKIKTSELTDKALDWAVSTIENQDWEEEGHIANIRYPDDDGWVYAPSTDWSQGGPIIEREEITIDYRDNETQARKWVGDRFVEARAGKQQGLLAAMRCYVASKLGDEVEVPDELM